MSDYFQQEKIENWVSDFCLSDSLTSFASAVQEYAPQLLTRFLTEACRGRDVSPEDLLEADLKQALEASAALASIPKSVLDEVPSLCALFLESLEDQGRLGGGRSMGQFVRTFRGRLGKKAVYKRPGSKLKRNDPCFCGSDRKFKQWSITTRSLEKSLNIFSTSCLFSRPTKTLMTIPVRSATFQSERTPGSSNLPLLAGTLLMPRTLSLRAYSSNSFGLLASSGFKVHTATMRSLFATADSTVNRLSQR